MQARLILKSFAGWITMIAVVAVCVVLVRLYLLESYQVSTSSMEDTLRKGDFILVNKLKQVDNPGRNRAVLFRSPLRQDYKEPPLFIGRCVGMPGDTLSVNKDGYNINGAIIPFSPNALKTYFVSVQSLSPFYSMLKELNIPIRNLQNGQFGKTLSLTEQEEAMLRDKLSPEANRQFVKEHELSYQLIIPKKGEAYKITEAALIAGKEVIIAEFGGRARIEDNKLFVDGRQTDYVRFGKDYYWMLSDNVNDAVDSRHLGFIPEDDIVGNVIAVWYSKDKERRFKKVR